MLHFHSMIAVFSLLFAVTSAMPASPVSDDVGIVTCQNYYTAPIRYAGLIPSETPEDYGTQTVSGELYVDTAITNRTLGEQFVFQSCNSSFMGYKSGVDQNGFNNVYGHIVELSTGLCLQASSQYPDFTPDVEPCSYSDDSSQLFQYWVLSDFIYQNSFYFIGEQASSSSGSFGMQLIPMAPPSSPPPAIFPATLSTYGSSQYILYFVTPGVSAP